MRGWIDRLLGTGQPETGASVERQRAWNPRDSRRTIAAAERALKFLEDSAQALDRARQQQILTGDRMTRDYLAAVRELQALEVTSTEAKKRGDEPAASAAISRIRQLDGMLPQLKDTVAQTESQTNELVQILARQRAKIQSCRQQLQHLRHQHAFNQAEAARLQTRAAMTFARETFDSARDTLEQHQYQLQAMEELTRDRTESLVDRLEQLEVDRELHRDRSDREGGGTRRVE